MPRKAKKSRSRVELLPEHLRVVEIPWLALETRPLARFPGTYCLNWARFQEAVMELGGWEAMPERWRELLKAGVRGDGWMKHSSPPIPEESLLPIRAAAREAVLRVGGLKHPHFPKGHHVAVSIFLRHSGSDYLPGHALVPATMLALKGVLWADDEQVRRIDIRTEPGRRGHPMDVWHIRVEECQSREWPEWVLTRSSDES